MRRFSTSAANAPVFSAADETNAAYWLNHEFLTEGNVYNGVTYKLPGDIISYIDGAHSWPVEPTTLGAATPSIPAGYAVVCGAAYMSVTEYLQYYPKFGVVDNMTQAEWDGWWLRSVRGDLTETPVQFVRTGGGGEIAKTSTMTTIQGSNPIRYVRPVFYLTDGFFRNGKLDVDALGQNVKNAILAAYPDAAALAAAGYSAGELASIGYEGYSAGAKPVARDAAARVSYPADNLSGALRAGVTLNGSYTYESADAEEQGSTFAWLSCASENGTYAPISGATAQDYTLQASDDGKYIKFQVTPKNSEGLSGDPAQSAAVGQVAAQIGPADRITANSPSVLNKTFAENTPPEYIFRLRDSNREFILLDEARDADSKYFVLAKDTYGIHLFHAARTTSRFNPDDSNNVGGWLNGDFKANGNGGAALPSKIIEHIDERHVWLTEAAMPASDAPVDYEFRAGIALLSQTEYLKYHAIIGVKDNLGPTAWMLRTMRGRNAELHTVLMLNTAAALGEGTSAFVSGGSAGATDYFQIRPAFWLKESFFTDAALDVQATGAKVFEAVRANYTAEDMLAAGYTEAEVYGPMGYHRLPSAENVKISGAAAVGELLTGEYTYNANGYETEGVSAFRWLRGDEPDGDFRPIAGETGRTYTARAGDAGKFLKFEVTPVSQAAAAGSVAAAATEAPVDLLSVSAFQYGVSGGRNVSASVTAKNGGAQSRGCMILVCVYDASGYMRLAVSKSLTVAAGETETAALSGVLTKEAAGGQARAFLLDGPVSGAALAAPFVAQ
jgi:hypothetical protein